MKNLRIANVLLLSLLLTLFSHVDINAYKNGDIVSKALNTDIVAYINHYSIPPFAVKGTSCVVAKDLQNFGFDVIWYSNNRSLDI